MMPANQNVQSFLKAVCDKKGLRFAVDLHTALQEGRDDSEARTMLRDALTAINRSSRKRHDRSEKSGQPQAQLA
jgi:hypothetical protein